MNIDESVKTEDVLEKLNKFAGLLETDKDMLHIKFAVGGIYKGFDGLRLSHDDAMRDIEGIAVSPNSLVEKIKLHKKHQKYTFSVEEETVLVNYLSAGQLKEGREYINAVIKNNFDNHASEVAMFNLYTRIASIILNVMRLKNITWDGSKIDDIDIVSEFFLLPPDKLRSAIEKMLDAIENNISVSKLNISEIILYIQEHYTEELYLDELADKYRTSASYLSRVLKENLGVTFTDYLSKIRVNKAKELLKRTDKPIAEISLMVGFGNRVTFTRAFTAHMNMSPSQYRKYANG